MLISRLRNVVLAGVLALSVSGCVGTQVGDLIAATKAVATTTVANPASPVDIYRVKNTYAATLELAVEYEKYCYARSYKSLLADPVAGPICKNRRAVLHEVQRRRPQVRLLIDKAETFIRNNPTLNAANVVTAAWDAVKSFQEIVPVTK